MPCRWARTLPAPPVLAQAPPLPSLRQRVRLLCVQEERDREVGERNIATKTIEILEIEKRGLQDHLRSRPDGAYDAARAKEKRRLQGHLRNRPGGVHGAHDAARAKDAKTAACVIS